MIFHLAAQVDVRVSVARPVFDATVNIIGSLNVCEGAVAAGVSKVVFAASGGTLYGDPDELPIREGQPQRPSRPTASPRRPSATTSTTTGRCAASSTRRSRWPTCTARARTRTARPASSRSSRASCSTRERPVIFGDGSQTRDFVYVDDVVDAFVRAVDKGGGLMMNIGTGVETSVQQLFDVMAQAHRVQAARAVRPAARRRAAAQRARPEPGRDPPRLEAVDDLEEGVARTLEHFKGQLGRTIVGLRLGGVGDPDRLSWPRFDGRRGVAPVARTGRAFSVQRSRSSSSGTGGRSRATYAGSGAPTSTSAWGSHSAGSASASRASSGQKIGAATQHDARPRVGRGRA